MSALREEVEALHAENRQLLNQSIRAIWERHAGVDRHLLAFNRPQPQPQFPLQHGLLDPAGQPLPGYVAGGSGSGGGVTGGSGGGEAGRSAGGAGGVAAGAAAGVAAEEEGWLRRIFAALRLRAGVADVAGLDDWLRRQRTVAPRGAAATPSPRAGDGGGAEGEEISRVDFRRGVLRVDMVPALTVPQVLLLPPSLPPSLHPIRWTMRVIASEAAHMGRAIARPHGDARMGMDCPADRIRVIASAHASCAVLSGSLSVTPRTQRGAVESSG